MVILVCVQCIAGHWIPYPHQISYLAFLAFIALTLLVGHQEERLASRAALSEIFHAQTKKVTDSAKKQNLTQFSACSK